MQRKACNEELRKVLALLKTVEDEDTKYAAQLQVRINKLRALKKDLAYPVTRSWPIRLRTKSRNVSEDIYYEGAIVEGMLKKLKGKHNTVTMMVDNYNRLVIEYTTAAHTKGKLTLVPITIYNSIFTAYEKIIPELQIKEVSHS